MNLNCARCGAHLELAPDHSLATCPYCGATELFEREPTPVIATPGSESDPEPGPEPSGAAVTTAKVIVIILGVMVVASLLGAVVAVGLRVKDCVNDWKDAPAVAQVAPPAKPEVARPIKVPERVVARNIAEQILEPELLACMRHNKVHRLWITIGYPRKYADPATFPPLEVLSQKVDYREVRDFKATPLGLCVQKAVDQIWTNAGPSGSKLAYMLVNPDVPDPLAGKPEYLNEVKTQKALAEFDENARDCARRQLPGWMPGTDSTYVIVTFRGVDGQAVQVRPWSQVAQTAYARCLEEAYLPAKTHPFKANMDQSVGHDLRL
ncbi:MAG: hypothetical protein ABIJ09_01460 [Pseudomonadota bacterium]